MTKNLPTPSFTANDVDIMAKKTLYSGFFTMVHYKIRHKLFNGGWSQPFEREIFEHNAAVGVLLFDPIQDCVVLIEQFRIGALNDPTSPWLLEIVAGLIQTDDKAEQIARKEVQEETNLTIQAIIPICQYWASPGGTSEKMHLFCARIDAQLAGGVFGADDEHEDIKSIILPTAQAVALINQHRICNAASIISLQWLALNKTWIQQQWIETDE